MEPFRTEGSSGHHVTPTIHPHMQNGTNFSTTLDVYNSTQKQWTSDEDFELSTTSKGMVENFELSTSALWLYFAVRILWGCLAIVGNSLTILVVAKFERLQTCTNYLICNLAANDMLAGVIVPLMMVHELFPNSRFFIPTCLFEKALSLLCTSGSMLLILYLSIDRYIYIAYPLRYHNLVTAQRMFITLGITWTLAFLTIPIMVFSANHLTVGMTCKYFIFLDTWVKEYYLGPQFMLLVFLTIGFHLAIAKIAHRQARAIAAQQQPYDTLETAINQSTKRISCTLGMVLGVYLLSLMPQFAVATATQQQKNLLPLEKFTVILYWANAWVNPLIYAWRLKDFRIAFKKLLTGTGSFNEVP